MIILHLHRYRFYTHTEMLHTWNNIKHIYRYHTYINYTHHTQKLVRCVTLQSLQIDESMVKPFQGQFSFESNES